MLPVVEREPRRARHMAFAPTPHLAAHSSALWPAREEPWGCRPRRRRGCCCCGKPRSSFCAKKIFRGVKVFFSRSRARSSSAMFAPTQRLYEDDEVDREDAKTEPLKALLFVWEPDAEGKYSHAPVSLLGARASYDVKGCFPHQARRNQSRQAARREQAGIEIAQCVAPAVRSLRSFPRGLTFMRDSCRCSRPWRASSSRSVC